VAEALAFQPQDAEAHNLLDKILASHPFPLELTTWDNPPVPYTIAAMRAYTFWRLDRPDDALNIMAEIYQVIEGLPYLPWLNEWLKDTTKLNAVRPVTMAPLLFHLSSKIKPGLSPDDHQHLSNLLETLEAYQEKFEQDSKVGMFLSIMNRKLGNLDRAFTLAYMAYRSHPDYFTADALGNVYRAKGMIEEAVQFYQEALSYDPKDLAIRLDIGDTLCQDGQIEKGLKAYREVLKVEPQHQWAYPSVLYYQGLLEPDGDWSERLEK